MDVKVLIGKLGDVLMVKLTGEKVTKLKDNEDGTISVRMKDFKTRNYDPNELSSIPKGIKAK